MIIAIDGPSGAGKSTLGRLLARALNLLYLDTGSMYRAVALAVIEAGLDPTRTEQITTLAQSIEIDLRGSVDDLRVILNGRDVTEAIRSEAVTNMSSIVSRISGVRHAMVKRQRELGRRGAVLNGRDIGTVVFPNADVKFFLTAMPEVRAQRRFQEVQLHNPEASLSDTFADMTERDRRDSTRTDSPLKMADDAIAIDSTGLAIEVVLQQMLAKIREKQSQQ